MHALNKQYAPNSELRLLTRVYGKAVRNNSRLVIFVATPTKGSHLFGDLFRMREAPTEKSFTYVT